MTVELSCQVQLASSSVEIEEKSGHPGVGPGPATGPATGPAIKHIFQFLRTYTEAGKLIGSIFTTSIFS
jgi:hypothetical protein